MDKRTGGRVGARWGTRDHREQMMSKADFGRKPARHESLSNSATPLIEVDGRMF